MTSVSMNPFELDDDTLTIGSISNISNCSHRTRKKRRAPLPPVSVRKYHLKLLIRKIKPNMKLYARSVRILIFKSYENTKKLENSVIFSIIDPYRLSM